MAAMIDTYTSSEWSAG
ncbi:hypothetical protein PDE_03091 [Penicillium oxalicum 114-2]|uniref:Uncharacterized protein n=1 Tax=Penicillium oxalicum (strain 114-2 / CGMCC 5302) TaxID=933388 RepID=S7ZBZ9_PENO1|nr:hypothetical protein PDE_03091 [Penicillium oxalicum 114-2]